jgi:hypothetical protein
MEKINNEEELTLMHYNGSNGIIICCKSCGHEFEETLNGYYQPIKYESDRYNRKCKQCLS